MLRNIITSPYRITSLDDVRVRVGKGKVRHSDLAPFSLCSMQIVSALSGGNPNDDSPLCTAPDLAFFVRAYNDSADARDLQSVKPYLPRLVNAHPTKEQVDAAATAAEKKFERTYGADKLIYLIESLTAPLDGSSPFTPDDDQFLDDVSHGRITSKLAAYGSTAVIVLMASIPALF